MFYKDLNYSAMARIFLINNTNSEVERRKHSWSEITEQESQQLQRPCEDDRGG